MPLHIYILRRVSMALLLVAGITVITFSVGHLLPADPIDANLSPVSASDPTIVAAFRSRWGLERPVTEQYLVYVVHLLHGDLGRSIRTGEPVADDLRTAFPATLELSTGALAIGVSLGVLLGLACAAWHNRPIDGVLRTIALIGTSFPIFTLALLALQIVHVQLGWAVGPGRLGFLTTSPPMVTGFVTVDSLLAGQLSTFRDATAHLILPCVVLGSFIAGLLCRITRAAMLDVLSTDYVRTARAKGLPWGTVLLRHGLRNALLPIITALGTSYGALLTGSIFVESIFAWPGIGRYLFLAATSVDFPAIVGTTTVIAVAWVLLNLLVDLSYYAFDPRLRAS